MPIIKHPKTFDHEALITKASTRKDFKKIKDATVSWTAKSGRKIRLTPNIEPEQVKLYEQLYSRIENLMKYFPSSIKHNPLARMTFIENANGKYSGFEKHRGKTLDELMLQKKIKPEDIDIHIQSLIRIYKKFRDQGIDHGNLHSENIYIDKEGKMQITDISKIRRANQESGKDLIKTIYKLLRYKIDKSTGILTNKEKKYIQHSLDGILDYTQINEKHVDKMMRN